MHTFDCIVLRANPSLTNCEDLAMALYITGVWYIRFIILWQLNWTGIRAHNTMNSWWYDEIYTVHLLRCLIWHDMLIVSSQWYDSYALMKPWGWQCRSAEDCNAIIIYCGQKNIMRIPQTFHSCWADICSKQTTREGQLRDKRVSYVSFVIIIAIIYFIVTGVYRLLITCFTDDIDQ